MTASTHRSASRPPLRVAYVIHNFGMAGLERCVARLVNLLDRDRFQPVIICLSVSGDAKQWLQVDDTPIIELNKADGNDPRVVKRLARVLRDNRIDVVHSHNWGTLVESVLARRWARVPVHVHAERGTVMGHVTLANWQRRIRGSLVRWALNRTDEVVAVSDAVRDRLVNRSGFEFGRIQVIPNGVDAPQVVDRTAQRKQVRRELGIGDDAVVIGSVGTLKPVKDHGTSITALSKIAGRGSDAHLVILGGGPDQQPLTELSKRLNVGERVHLVGQQTDVGRWMSAMDIYENSSISEGMSQAILEAMAFGLPLVVTDVGDSAESVGHDGRCGIVLPPSNADAMAEAFAQLSEHAELRTQMGANAKLRHHKNYAPQPMVRAYETLYETAASRRATRAVPSDAENSFGLMQAMQN